MENLERLAGSIAQIELLMASLKRENRDLAARLAQAGTERHQADLAAEARLKELQGRLDEAQTVLRNDPGLEARAQRSELEAADLAKQLDQARRSHFEEKGRLEALVRQLEAQLLASRGQEELPTASPQALDAAHKALEQAKQSHETLEGRAARLELDLGILHGQLEQSQEREAQAAQTVAALRARQAELEKRVTSLESSGLDLERQLGEAQRMVAASTAPAEVDELRQRLQGLQDLAGQADALGEQSLKLESEKLEIKKQKRELAAFAKERAQLRRKVEELVATLENVRLG